jgi:mono/diheme cytochrome c family protein
MAIKGGLMITAKIKFLIAGGAAIVFGLLLINASFADDPSRGMLLYQSNCLQCHGEKGDGIGPAAAGLVPNPTDLTSSQMSTLTDALLEKAVVEGISTVPMHSWGNTLSKEDVAAVIKYTRTFQK